MDGEGDVLGHDETVGDGDAGEDHVDGVPHVPVGEHQDVGQVEESSKDTDHHGQPAVDRVVEVLGGIFSFKKPYPIGQTGSLPT